MKVLFVSEEFPYPLDTGGNVRTFHLLRALAAEHEVHLLCLEKRGLREQDVAVVRPLVRAIHFTGPRESGPVHEARSFVRSITTRRSFLLERHRSAALQRRVRELLLEISFDAIHFNHLDAALYGECVPDGVRQVLDQHNVVTNQAKTTLRAETRLPRRLVLQRDLPLLSRQEALLCNRMETCLVCSDDDAVSLQRLGVSSRCVVVPNGVDLEYFSAAQTLASGPSMVFVGTLDYDPCERGVWYFCNEILPLIRAQWPEASFTAIGRNPSRRLLDLQGSASGIEFTGRVEDLRPMVHKGRVFVVPLLSGSGTRLKILEAMAMGIPVVSTTIGAEGIAGKDGEHLRIADTPESFARAVIELVSDEKLAATLRSNGRRLVEAAYSWEESCRRLLAAYAQGKGSGAVRE